MNVTQGELASRCQRLFRRINTTSDGRLTLKQIEIFCEKWNMNIETTRLKQIFDIHSIMGAWNQGVFLRYMAPSFLQYKSEDAITVFGNALIDLNNHRGSLFRRPSIQDEEDPIKDFPLIDEVQPYSLSKGPNGHKKSAGHIIIWGLYAWKKGLD
eukprot:UN03917